MNISFKKKKIKINPQRYNNTGFIKYLNKEIYMNNY